MRAGLPRTAGRLLPRRTQSLAKVVVGAAGRPLIGRRYRLREGYERIYLHHVRKTGGTSLASSFLALGGEEPAVVKHRMANVFGMARSGDYVFAANVLPALEGGRYLFGWSHRPAWRLSLPQRTYTVTILRDPTARALSLYRYLRDPDSDGDEAFPAPEAERRLASEGFDGWLDRVGRNHLLHQLYMFSEAFDPAEAAEVLQRCSLVFGVKEMEHGLATLGDLTGHELRSRRERRSNYEFEPTDAQLSCLRAALKPEYELMERLRSMGFVSLIP